jgi:hypothetical protein
VLYVARHKDVAEEQRKSVAREAASIFWLGSLAIGAGMFFFVNYVLATLYPVRDGVPRWATSGADYTGGYWCLALQFFAAFFAANGVNDFIRKHPWYVRIPLFTVCIGVYLFLLSCPGLLFRRPAINVMQFAACMLPTHCWGRFKDVPNQPRAWAALVACLAGATLFFVVSYFGEDFAQWVCRMCPFLIWPISK